MRVPLEEVTADTQWPPLRGQMALPLWTPLRTNHLSSVVSFGFSLSTIKQ